MGTRFHPADSSDARPRPWWETVDRASLWDFESLSPWHVISATESFQDPVFENYPFSVLGRGAGLIALSKTDIMPLNLRGSILIFVPT